MPILPVSARLVFLLARCRERLIFSVSARDVRLENGGPPPQSGRLLSKSRAAGRRAAERFPVPLRWTGWVCVTRSLAADVANVFFPSDCAVCDAPLLSLSRTPVCATCRDRVRPLAGHAFCSRCGDGLAPESARFAAAHGLSECTQCRLAPPEFERAVAFTTFDAAAREMLHLLKFRRMAAAASTLLGEGMGHSMSKLLADIAPNALCVPVPLFAARERERGFNQADLLARAGLAYLRKAHHPQRFELRGDVLRRVKDTRSSFAMAPHDRRINLRGAFRVTDAAAVQGREVMLVDDILTTGATARECARVLLRAGAVRVWVATYARTLAEGSGPDSFVAWSPPAMPSPSG